LKYSEFRNNEREREREREVLSVRGRDDELKRRESVQFLSPVFFFFFYSFFFFIQCVERGSSRCLPSNFLKFLLLPHQLL
jgi:hypothetical protein